MKLIISGVIFSAATVRSPSFSRSSSSTTTSILPARKSSSASGMEAKAMYLFCRTTKKARKCPRLRRGNCGEFASRRFPYTTRFGTDIVDRRHKLTVSEANLAEMSGALHISQRLMQLIEGEHPIDNRPRAETLPLPSACSQASPANRRKFLGRADAASTPELHSLPGRRPALRSRLIVPPVRTARIERPRVPAPPTSIT